MTLASVLRDAELYPQLRELRLMLVRFAVHLRAHATQVVLGGRQLLLQVHREQLVLATAFNPSPGRPRAPTRAARRAGA